MTSHRIGVNLRVSGNCDQGARKYMEDNHVIKFLKKDTDDYEFAYFGIFDGHGGPEASAFCKDNLLNEITKYDGFWTDEDDQVLAAIRKGFLDTHNAMWNVLDTWPKTVTGLPSTAGSTATIAIIKQGKLYTGHVGDSALVLGETNAYSGDEFPFQAICITKEHKPDDPDERLRILDAGGEVINKSGVPRVVWSRPKSNHKGPVRRSTHIDQIPFLAVARSLGDLWSYDFGTETYVVSPDPDVTVMKLDPNKHRCLILASDGLWNMVTPEEAVNVVMDLESQFEQKIISDPNVSVSFWSNPAERLVFRALNKWRSKSLKADNTSCVVVLIDPLGPSKLTLLKQKRQALLSGSEIMAPLNKVSQLPSVNEHRNKSRNKNSNCSLSTSHIRATDDSILDLMAEREQIQLPPQRRSFSAASKLERSEENTYIQPLHDSVQVISKWNLRHSVDNGLPFTSKGGNTQIKKPTLPNGSQNLNMSCRDVSHRNSVLFTKLMDTSHILKDKAEDKHGVKMCHQIQHLNCCQLVDNIHDDFINHEDNIEVEESEKGLDSDFEKWSSKPLTVTPCTDVNESDEESSLHSSADVTNKAFSMASNESLDSSKSSGDDNHPPTPQSAPAKLSLSRARRGSSKRSKRKLTKSGKRLKNLSKPPLDLKTKLINSQLSALSKTVDKSCSTASEAANTGISTEAAKVVAGENAGSSVVTTSVNVSMAANDNTHSKAKTSTNSSLTPQKLTSRPRKVLNTSKSVNDVSTPKNQKEQMRSLSCTGLTPDLSLLMSEIPRDVLNNTSAGLTSHLLSSLMAADTAESRNALANEFRKDASMMAGDRNMPHKSSFSTQTEPLKQLNKTGPIRKSGSKKWGHFLRTSKQSIDQMLHFGSQRKSTGKLSTTSVGKLECDNSKIVYSKRTLSTPRMNITLAYHNPDTTLGHEADLTIDASTLTTGDLTNLSALSGDDSMLTTADLTTIHHSLLEDGLPGKVKQHKGFLQKTKVTLRRASKAAKKAFFPENHRLFHKSVKKRRSNEFLPTPEMKRRKQVEAN